MSTTRSFMFFALAFTASAAPLLPQQPAHIVPFWPWHPSDADSYGLRPVRQAIQMLIDTEQGHSDPPSSPAADILAPYEHTPSIPPNPNANTTLIPHAMHPASPHHADSPRTSLIIGTVSGVIFALLVLWFFLRVFMRRRSLFTKSFPLSDENGTRMSESYQEPHSNGNRLSDESWLQSSPQPTLKLETTPFPVPPCPPRSHGLQLRKFTFPRGTKSIPVTSASPTVFGSRTELVSDEKGEQTLGYSEIGSISLCAPSPMCPTSLCPSPFPIPPNSPPPSPLQTSLNPSPTNSEAGDPLIISSPGDDLDLQGSRLSRLLASSFHDDHTCSFRKKSMPRGTVDLRIIRAHVHRRSRSTTNSLYARARVSGRGDCGTISRSITSMSIMRDSVYGQTRSGLAFPTRPTSSSYVHLTSLADEDTIPNHFPDHRRDTMATITTITTQETMSTSNVSYLFREAGAGPSYSEHLPVLKDAREREQDCMDDFAGSGCISGSVIGTVTPSLSVSASTAVSFSPSMASSITGIGLGIMRMDADAQERVRAKEKERERARERERVALREREGQRRRTRDSIRREKEKEKARERGWKPPGSPSTSRTRSSASSSRSNSPSPMPVSLAHSVLREDFSSASHVIPPSSSASPLAETPSSVTRTRASTISEIDLYTLPDPDYSSPSPTLSTTTASFPSPPPTKAPRMGRGGTRKRLVGKLVPSLAKTQKRPPSIHERTKSAPVTSS